MAAFDLNSLYFVKNAAPRTSSFEETVAPMSRGFELGKAYNENYNRNSLQNLIAQREQEGIPYDRLSNEAAKWDLGAANAMRGERRTSLKYNYEQDVAEFENWRKNMARRICGLILQKADEIGMPPESLDRVLNVAASYVVTYDEALAQWLLGQSRIRSYDRGRLNRKNDKPIKDHEKEISAVMENASRATGDGESDPNAIRFRTKLKNCAQRLLQWKLADPYDAVSNPDGRLIWKRMLSALVNEPNPSALTDEQVTALVQNAGQEDDFGNEAIDNMASATAGRTQNSPAVATGAAVASNESDNFGLRPIARKSSATTGAMVIDPKALGQLSAFADELSVDDSDFKAKLKAARKVISEGAVIKDNDMKSQSITPIQQVLKEKEKKYNDQIEMLKELGVKNPEDAFRKFKDLFGQRASIATVTQFRNFNSFVNSYISKAPMTAISNGLLVGTPTYKPTVEEFKQAKSLHGTWGDETRNALRKMGIPIASVIAENSSEHPALWALASDVQKQIRGIWDADSRGLSPEKYRQLKELYTNLFHIDKNAWDIIEGRKDFPQGDEYERQLKKMVDNQEKNQKPADLSGVSNDSPARQETTNTTSAKEWLAKRRAAK